ncbi:MAG TPA: hypothetical protein VJ694_05020 [Patescibacteria group bacterium]|nr:hypothetical protein [Patescibacteria group bacterium]
MRSLLCLTFTFAACGGSRAPGALENRAAIGSDPELASACVPEWSTPPDFCPKDEAGLWILPEDDPTNPMVTQVMELERLYHSPSMDRTIVKQMTRVIEGGKASECGKRVCRWHRALALHRLERWREAFLDFASVVKDGPNNPYYDVAGEWLKTLEPYVPRDAYITCLSAYDQASIPKTAPTE